METYTPTHRIAVSYIDKSRLYYRNQGFDNPYRWATHTNTPFATLKRPLNKSRIAIVTTAAPNEAGGERENRQVWAAPSGDIPNALHTHHVFWHKKATHTDDLGTFLPMEHLYAAAEDGRIGSVAPRFYGVPTKYSQRQTAAQDAPAILAMCREDAVDGVILIPM